jgi:hypothetical protein
MPAKRVIPQSSDSDTPIVVTPRKNTSSFSALLAQDRLLSRASRKLAPQEPQTPPASAFGRNHSPATPHHASKIAFSSAAPPKLAKHAVARRRASNPRIAALSSVGPTAAGPVSEISASSFYPSKEPEWTKRCALRSTHAAAGPPTPDNTRQVGKNRRRCRSRRGTNRQ